MGFATGLAARHDMPRQPRSWQWGLLYMKKHFASPIKSGAFCSPAGWITLVDGKINNRIYRTGVGFCADKGAAVFAVADGTVTVARHDKGGQTMLITHTQLGGVQSYYAHLSEVKLSDGASVKKGQLIALSGRSGKTDEAMLHFEFLINDERWLDASALNRWARTVRRPRVKPPKKKTSQTKTAKKKKAPRPGRIIDAKRYEDLMKNALTSAESKKIEDRRKTYEEALNQDGVQNSDFFRK